MNRFKKFLGITILGTITVLCCPVIASADTIVCEGVFVDEVDIGGKTKEQAQELVKQYTDSLPNRKITVKANDKSCETTFKDIGFTTTENNYVDNALNIGKVGNIIQRYKDVLDAKNGKKVFQTEFAYDEEKLANFVNEECKKCDKEVKEPTLDNAGQVFNKDNIKGLMKIKKGENGQVVNKEVTLNTIKDKLKEWDKKDLLVEAEVDEKQPTHSEDQLNECCDRIGSFNTNFSSSSSDRKANIVRASSLANGSIVYPDDTFSLLSKITPFTTKNGYHSAPSYSNGKTVDSIGGGCCQVSTTLYNAVLFAELEVTERRCHSMEVHYVDYARDAMIAESANNDFKFKNNLKYPVYIESFTSGGNLYFNLYSKKTEEMKNRHIELKTENVKKIPRGQDQVETDSSIPAGTERVVSNGCDGTSATLYKYVTVGGKTEKIKVNQSSYKASPRRVIRGTGSGGGGSVGGTTDGYVDNNTGAIDP